MRCRTLGEVGVRGGGFPRKESPIFAVRPGLGDGPSFLPFGQGKLASGRAPGDHSAKHGPCMAARILILARQGLCHSPTEMLGRWMNARTAEMRAFWPTFGTAKGATNTDWGFPVFEREGVKLNAQRRMRSERDGRRKRELEVHISSDTSTDLRTNELSHLMPC